jgi:hypothetical protein
MLIDYLFNSTALLGGGIYPSSNWDISAAACSAFFPGCRLLGFDLAATKSFAVWLLSSSFRDRLTPRLGRRFSTVSLPFSLSLPELSLLEEEEEDSLSSDEEDGEGTLGEGILQDGDGESGW